MNAEFTSGQKSIPLTLANILSDHGHFQSEGLKDIFHNRVSFLMNRDEMRGEEKEINYLFPYQRREWTHKALSDFMADLSDKKLLELSNAVNGLTDEAILSRGGHTTIELATIHAMKLQRAVSHELARRLK